MKKMWMKKMWKKSLAILLILAALASLASCSENAVEKTETGEGGASGGEQGTIEEPIEEEDVLKDNLPELNFNGETVNIFYPMGTGRLDAVGDIEGDVVDVAVYNRNLAVNDRLNVELNWIEGMQYPNELGFPQEVHKLIMAGDTSFDIATEETSFCFQYMLQGDFRDLGHLPYLELDQPWWFTDFMEKGMITPEKKYYLTGAAVLSCFQRAGCTHFNKELFTTAFGDVEQIYTMVDEHEWTYDAIETFAKAIYQDLDNDGKASGSDIVGVANNGFAMVNYLSSSNGLSYIVRDEEGWPSINLYNEETNRWVEILYHMMKEDNISVEGGDFSKGRILFQFGLLSELFGGMRELDLEHGVLPYPLIDSGNEYVTCAGAVNGSSFVIPITTPESKDELCGAVLEALCSEAYRNVLPVWLETALKSKYSDTQRDADMIDIIYRTIDNDLMLMTDKQTGGATGSFFANFLSKQNKAPGQFASYYASMEKQLNKLWSIMLEKYQKLGE